MSKVKYVSLQAEADSYHDGYVNKEISRLAYAQLMDAMWHRMTDAERQGVKNRIDRMYGAREKTLAWYALKLLDNTLREHKFSCLLEARVGGRFINLGFDNTGRLCLNGKKVKDSGDYLWEINGRRFPTEFKFLTSFNTYTIGKRQYDTYVNNKNYILILATDGVMVGPNGDPALPDNYEIDTSALWVTFLSPEEFVEAMSKAHFGYHWQQPGCMSYQLQGRDTIIENLKFVKFDEFRPAT
jgi:hypothetical protein